jgi:hypothetical protein
VKVSKAFFNSIKGFQKGNSDDWALAGESLLTFISFRFNDSSSSYFVLSLKVLKDSLRMIWKGTAKQPISISTNSANAIFDTSSNNLDLRKEYLSTYLKVESGLLCSKQDLLFSKGIAYKLGFTLDLFLFYFRVFFVSNKKGKLINYALLTKEYLEVKNLVTILKQQRIEMVYDFANYEVDSNVLYLILKENGINVCKIPSCGPLQNHNSILLTDELVVSSGYHLEELVYLDKVKYKKLIKSYPEMATRYMHKYPEIPVVVDENNLKTIGYYSHASWLRKKQGHSDNGLNILQGETSTLALIADFVFKNPTFKLIVFLHPREKKIVDDAELLSYYENILKGVNYEFAPFDLKTSESFDFVNVAIVALSTMLFERLFAGRKVLICKKGLSSFPHNDSKLGNISFDSSEQLYNLMMSNYSISDKEYIETNELNAHVFKNFRASA